MAKITIPKKALEQKPKLTPGFADVRFDGFKPEMSAGKNGKEKSLNLKPQMFIINHPTPEMNGRQVYDWLNVNAGFVIEDFLHAFGVQYEVNPTNSEDKDIPGEFIFAGANPLVPTGYNGPLLGQVGKVELMEHPAKDKNGNPTGDTAVDIKRYICRVPGCTVAHRENLIRA